MRDFKGMKRQRGRNRGGNAGGGGGGKPQHNVNRAFDSNGPDGVKIRGNAQHVFEKYQQLARDAAGAGDRVLAEGYLQHAEHYFRVLRAVQPQRPPSDFLGRETFASGYDIDFEDESNNTFTEAETVSEGENQAAEGESFESRGEQNQNRDQNQNRGERDWQNRDQNRDRNFNRDRQRDDRPGPSQRRPSQRIAPEMIAPETIARVMSALGKTVSVKTVPATSARAKKAGATVIRRAWTATTIAIRANVRARNSRAIPWRWSSRKPRP